jgi:hypothetical protein
MIKLRITTAGGTKIELDIPIDDSKPASIESAVPYQPEPVTPVETATETQDEVVRLFDEPTPVQPATDLEDAMWKYKTSPTFPSNQDLEPIENERRDGEKGEDGRIGGVGERKEDGEKGKPERLDTQNIFTITFDCKNGCYCPPTKLTKIYIEQYGEQTVLQEYLQAQAWLLANPTRMKTIKGTGRFLNSWLRRARKFAMQNVPARVHQKADNLLSNANTQTEGW